MTKAEAIMLALATGAASRLRPNNWDQDWPEVDAYHELEELLAQSYPGVEADMMEVAPGSKDRQELLIQQISESGADDDDAVLAVSRRLLEEVETRVPQAIAAAGADLVAVEQALVELREAEEAD